MADLEAQTEAEPLGSQTSNLLIPRRELSHLVQMLADSVRLVQAMVEGDDQTGTDEDDKQNIRTLNSDDHIAEEGGTADIDDHKEEESVSRVIIASPEEIANRLHLGPSIVNEMTMDPWSCLKHIDWAFTFREYTVAESRADTKPGEQDVPAIIHHYTENPDLRLEVQKELYYGLSRWWWSYGHEIPSMPETSTPEIRHRGILDMAPWVSLIGMRLPDFRSGEKIDKTGSKDVTRVRILTILLDLQQVVVPPDDYSHWREGELWADHVTVGQVLDQCYRYRILERPDEQDIEAYREHVGDLIVALRLMNLWSPIPVYQRPEIGSVSWARSMKMSTLCHRLHKYDFYGQRSPRCQDSSFRSYEMSLELLRNVGKLRIEWTEFLDDHLRLDVGKVTLKVFWFGFTIQASPIFHMGCQQYNKNYDFCHQYDLFRSPIFDELSDTYSLLFRSRRDAYKENIREYGLLPVPQWLRVCYGDEKGTLSERIARDMSWFLHPKRPRVSDIEYHLQNADKRLLPTQLFERYRIWGDRLRELKAYMDSQKPGGIRGLWADKRDSGQWYTFWAVLIIGGLGLLISFLGLVAGIVQAVASFKALND
ncbi:hypothetical protein LTR10_018648 [Elasticomyces elasticus]|nr:hypothetical protein LTR10_018648 [Elasticomyces elasticus]KAK5043180.1 hypothetical protein LTR13_000951 [Exophiala sideris]